MEPVEIDIRLKQNVEAEGKKVEQTFEQITAAAKKAQADALLAVQEQKTVIKQIESDIKGIEKQISKAAPGNAQAEMISELNRAKMALQEEKAALNDVEISIDKTAQKHTMLRTQVMNVKDALSQLEMAGKRGTSEYKAMESELGRLNNQMQDTNMQAKILADDQRGFKAVASGISGLTGAMTAAVGAMSLFGAENEELARIQTRLQAVMAITIGVQQVSEALNKDEYFSAVLLTKAKNMWAAANLKVAATLGISNVAAKALMATVTLGLSVAIGALIYMVDKLISKNAEQKKAAEEAAKVQADAAQVSANDYAKEIANVQVLRAALTSENVPRKKKLEIIEQLKKIMPGYNAELSTEGKLIRENKTAVDEYMQSVEKSIKLKIEEGALQKIYAERYKIEQKQFQRPALATDEALRAEDEFNAWKTAELDLSKKKEDEIKKRINVGGLVSIVTATGGSGGTSPDKKEKEQYDAELAIQKMLLDINDQTTKLLLDQRADGLQKTLDAISIEEEAEIAKIQEKEQAIVDAYNKSHKDDKGFVAVKSLSQIDPKQAEGIEREITKMQSAYSQKRAAEQKAYYLEIEKFAKESADERVKITNDYEKNISDLRLGGQEDAAKGLEADRDKKIGDITLGILEESELYKVASDDKLELSRETTALLIADLQKRIDAEIAAGKLSKEQGEKWLADLQKAKTSTDKGNKNNPFAQLGSAITNNTSAQKAYKNAPAGLPTEELAQLEDAAASATASMAGAAGAALQGVHDILQSVVGGLDQLGLLTEEEKKDADNIIGMVSGAANLAMGIASGNPMQIIQGSIDLLVNAFVLFDKKSKDIAKKQKALVKQVDDLQHAYSGLEKAIEKAFSSDKAKLQRDEIANIQAQIKANNEWVEQEYRKKRKKQDAAAIEARQRENEALKQDISDKKDAIIESMTGTDVMSAIDEFANAYADAFSTGEDAAEKSAEIVKNILKKGLVENLKKELQPGITQLMTLVSDAMADGILSADEKAQIEIKKQQLDAKAQQDQKMFADLGLGEDKSREGAKKGIATASQDSIDELTGGVYALRMGVADIRNNSREQTLIIRTITNQLDALIDNTEPIAEMAGNIKLLSDDIREMKTRGIIVKV